MTTKTKRELSRNFLRNKEQRQNENHQVMALSLWDRVFLKNRDQLRINNEDTIRTYRG